MSKSRSTLTPKWFEEAAPSNSYRSLFKWGDPLGFKHPNPNLVKLLKETFSLTEDDLKEPSNLGLEPVDLDLPIHLTAEQVRNFKVLVGPDNVTSEAYPRIRASYGAGMIDALRLRRKIVEHVPDLVLYPRTKEDINKVVAYCNEQRIPLYIFGGGSTVTRGMEAVKGGVTLDMSRHMNRVVAFNEINQTITVEAGMSGPQLEKALNEAPERFGATRRYTCGHFPQSFEYSSVGGWVVTRGAGQNSTYYGKIEHMVISQEYCTPIGIIKTHEFPAVATGPDIDELMIGAEGTFGVLTEVTLRFFRHNPQNHIRFSYMFHTWEDAMNATREIMQNESGYPSVFRLSDPEETDVAMKLYNIEGTPAETLLNLFGFKRMQKCLLLGFTDGERGFCKNLDRNIRKIARRYKAFDLSLFPVVQHWEKNRFRDPYMREDLQDYGVLIDTLECGVNWAMAPKVHEQVRAFVKSRPNTICMTHMSHFYPQGVNLYFIFIAKIATIREYLDLQYGILEAIRQSGAAMSHHHGLGKQTAPWLEEEIGTPAMNIIRLLKKYFDPNNIMNPGGTIGLDMSVEQREKRWSKDLEG